MTSETITGVIIAFSAIAALFFNYFALKESTRSRNLATFQSLFLEIRNLEEKYFKEYYGKGDREKRNFLLLFFNTWEYYAFLVNNELLIKKLAAFYNDAFKRYYEEVFKIAMPAERDDSNQFKEMRKLYSKLEPKN
jgi:hypothetical protein